MSKQAKTKTLIEKQAPRPLGPDAQLCDRLQAAELLGVSYGSIRNLERKGKLKGRTLTSGSNARLMFPVTDVLALAQVNKITKLLPDLGSVIVVNGKTYREVIDGAAA
jgi:hypothetical protein